MKISIFIISCLLIVTGCSDKSEIKLKNEILKTKDPNVHFVVEYYDDGTLSEVLLMRQDSSFVRLKYHGKDELMAINTFNKGKSMHTTEYFDNGRPKGLVNLDSTFTGDAIYYYENGNKRSEGHWKNYERAGIWKNYNEKGGLSKIDTFKE